MFAPLLQQLRDRRPLVHAITNYVTANDCANLLLACGASPVMADDPDDAPEITAHADGLVLNLGTLHRGTIPAMLACGRTAARRGLPVVLDPVGVGASAAAVSAMGLCGEIAHTRLGPLDGNGSYRSYLLDAVYRLTPDQLEKGARYELR